MHLLYLDESGNPKHIDDRHFVVAGLSTSERNTFPLSRQIDAIKEKHFPNHPPIDFHVSHIRNGKGFWRAIPGEVKKQILEEIGSCLLESYAEVRLFGAVVEKSAANHGDAAIRAAVQDVCKRFDLMLKRRLNDRDDQQRGLIVMAESSYQAQAKAWISDFSSLGTQWGVLHSLCDIPYFAPASESRLLQLADFVAHALYLLYEKRDDSLARMIIHKFDCNNGRFDGLVHLSANRGYTCECPACASRRTAFTVGGWIADPVIPTWHTPKRGTGRGQGTRRAGGAGRRPIAAI